MKSLLDPKNNPGLFSGPLGQHVGAYVEQLKRQGYKRPTIYPDSLLLADLDAWMKRRKAPASGVSASLLERFLKIHMRKRRSRRRAKRATLRRLFQMLQSKGVVEAKSYRRNRYEQHVYDFAEHLKQERGCVETTIAGYCLVAKRLLSYVAGNYRHRLARMSAIEVLGFAGHYIREHGRVSAQYATPAMRAFLRFLRYRGIIEADLASIVPSVAGWTLAGLPRCLPKGTVERVLADQEHASPGGRRDYAILLLLARLGLRSCEVAALRLDDLHWESGEIIVRSRKASRTVALPLPCDVARAVAEYLKVGRPVCNCRNVFVRLRAPFGGMSRIGVGHVARRAFLHSRISGVSLGAHTFRHTLASDLLRRGASLDDIGRILRHRDASTTAIYAKVDIEALRSLAMRWPGGAV